MFVGEGPVGSVLIWHWYSPGLDVSMMVQFSVGFGGAELSWRTRGEGVLHPQTVSFPATSEMVAVQKAMETS